MFGGGGWPLRDSPVLKTTAPSNEAAASNSAQMASFTALQNIFAIN
jgi:hypothetical protein